MQSRFRTSERPSEWCRFGTRVAILSFRERNFQAESQTGKQVSPPVEESYEKNFSDEIGDEPEELFCSGIYLLCLGSRTGLQGLVWYVFKERTCFATLLQNPSRGLLADVVFCFWGGQTDRQVLLYVDRVSGCSGLLTCDLAGILLLSDLDKLASQVESHRT